jgi:hypothetical protein
MYVAKQTYNDLGNDLYDSSGKLWKLYIGAVIATTVPYEGEQLAPGNSIVGIWDFQIEKPEETARLIADFRRPPGRTAP